MTRTHIRSFLARYMLFTAIFLVVGLSSTVGSDADGEERKILKGNLTCITRQNGNTTTKLFHVDEEEWPCFNDHGVNYCGQVSLYGVAKESCLVCCKRQKKEKENKGANYNSSTGEIKSQQQNGKKDNGVHKVKSHTIDIVVGCGCALIMVFSVAGLVSYYRPRQTNQAQNPPMQQEMQPMQQEMQPMQQEMQPMQQMQPENDIDALQVKQYVGLGDGSTSFLESLL